MSVCAYVGVRASYRPSPFRETEASETPWRLYLPSRDHLLHSHGPDYVWPAASWKKPSPA